MKLTTQATTAILLAVLLWSRDANADSPPVAPPPESFFALVDSRDRDSARRFYKKYLDVKGLPVVASPEVADLALQRTYFLVTHLLAGRPDLLAAMVKNRMYLIIIGKDQVYTDMPEYRNSRNPEYLNERMRGTGGRPTSFGEENLLCLPLDRYDDESIAVHEFCHTIDGTLRRWIPRGMSARTPSTGRPSTRVCGRTPTPARIPGNTGRKFARSILMPIGSTTGTTVPSAHASSSRCTIPRATNS